MIDVENDATRILAELLREQPKFHGQDDAGSANYAIAADVLSWFAENVPLGGRSLETGCGYTTVVFAARSAHHTVISPFPQEHELIRSWCDEHHIRADHVEFIAAPSQKVLPGLEGHAFDFVLIDGDHAFPAPFIDWYYTAEGVKDGGFVAVDDTQLVTGKILRDFLAEERGRWALAREIGKTAIFRRVTPTPVTDGIWWGLQPYVKNLWMRPPTLSEKVYRGAEKVLGVVLPKPAKRLIRGFELKLRGEEGGGPRPGAPRPNPGARR